MADACHRRVIDRQIGACSDEWRRGMTSRRRFRPWIRSVLVGLDDHADSRIALGWAAHLAETFSARLVVVDVWEHPSQFPGPTPFTSREQDERLQRAVALLDTNDLDVELVPAIGDVGDALLSTADRYDADLIVIGNHHEGRLHQLVSGGGTGRELLRKGHRSVLVVDVADRHRRLPGRRHPAPRSSSPITDRMEGRT